MTAMFRTILKPNMHKIYIQTSKTIHNNLKNPYKPHLNNASQFYFKSTCLETFKFHDKNRFKFKLS